jgi:hypothetical protein
MVRRDAHPRAAAITLGGADRDRGGEKATHGTRGSPPLALVTGGSPISHGVFYDVSYDRTLSDPTNVTCSGRGQDLREPTRATLWRIPMKRYLCSGATERCGRKVCPLPNP